MKRLVAAVVVLFALRTAAAKDLLEVYADAAQHDPQIREADATRRANEEANPQALAALLPQLNGNYQVNRFQQYFAQGYPYPSPTGQTVVLDQTVNSLATTRGYQLQLKQSVFSWANWATLSRAHKQVARAEADYRAAEEDLIQRTAQAYFNVLNAQDSLDAQLSALEALTRQLDQANKRYDVGLIPITDVKEAQAQHDSTAAAVIDAKRNLASMQDALREITGEDYPFLAKPGDDMPLQTPQPADPLRWVSVSMDQNLSLLSARLAADVARENVYIAQAGHAPTIDITGTRSNLNQFGDARYYLAIPGAPPTVPVPYPGEQSNKEIGIQITVPIFSGGLVSSQARQAQYNWIAAKDHVVTVSRQTEHQARDAYSTVVSEVSRVNALKQGVDSAQVALKATEAGYDVGTRTQVEVLQQRENLTQAETNYAQARYNYILNIVSLRLAAGTLDQQTLADINAWLTVKQPTPTSITAPTPPVPPQP
jgi:outer membrane protein